MPDPDTRLASYGTLAPGRVNHHQLDGLTGAWREGVVRGTLVPDGWGATFGYPALVLGEDGAPVDVWLFESLGLPAHWQRLDAFEGDGYRRVIARVETADGDVNAWIYVSAEGRLP
ncbi:gamma-glutamylcyclotransferase [Sphingoaurantiacus capsulatus]|uniref:Gamma-glutamylcyclotransferase n=1 Tax=Sphingoaurantiacus capsulatus TaxID=1771310 RepID=A0ABV7XEX2_9SPHN